MSWKVLELDTENCCSATMSTTRTILISFIAFSKSNTASRQFVGSRCYIRTGRAQSLKNHTVREIAFRKRDVSIEKTITFSRRTRCDKKNVRHLQQILSSYSHSWHMKVAFWVFRLSSEFQFWNNKLCFENRAPFVNNYYLKWMSNRSFSLL